MWQVLLAAAAAAGSGILAKKLTTPIDAEKPIIGLTQNDHECDQNLFSQPQDSIFRLEDTFPEDISRQNKGAFSDEGKIFKFSSPEAGSTESRKNIRNGFREIKKIGGSKRGKKNGSVEDGGKGLVVDQRGNGSRKKVSVCLKKRRTGKHTAGKCESCASKDNSFGWGVGVGIMYMMSAGNAEISRLNSAMDETVNSVQELKAEISRRKSSSNTLLSVAEHEDETNKKHLERNYRGGPLVTKVVGKSQLENAKSFYPECATSVVTVDEQQPEVLEMDRLEAELEFELQKLPWSATAGSNSEADVLVKEHYAEEFENSISYQYDGVKPAELDRKLSNLLIERQESQIEELEAELQNAHSKLHEKEAELQALKDCIKRLTQFSLAAASDDEAEDVKREDMGYESTPSTVGMKRQMGFGSYSCSPK